MRYSSSEKTVLVGQLTPGRVVSIKIINLLTDTLIDISNSTCVESEHIPGLYLWSTNDITPGGVTGFTNLLYEMKQGDEVYYGKFVYGGYVDEDGNVDVSGIITDLTEVIETLNIINARM